MKTKIVIIWALFNSFAYSANADELLINLSNMWLKVTSELIPSEFEYTGGDFYLDVENTLDFGLNELLNYLPHHISPRLQEIVELDEIAPNPTRGNLRLHFTIKENKYGEVISFVIKDINTEYPVVILPNPSPVSLEQNWIKTVTNLDEDGKKSFTDISYYNGLGYPMQIVNVKASTNGKNIVTHIAYDVLMRNDAKSYLQYVNSSADVSYDATPIENMNAFYGEAYNDLNYFSQKIYEKSPLNRVEREVKVGKEFQSDHNKLYTYGFNTESEVLKLVPVKSVQNNISICTIEGYWPANTLSKKISKDEDGRETISFMNSQGQILLIRVVGPPDADTYYYYDEIDRLICIISPDGSNGLVSGTTLTSTSDIGGKCFLYKYDKYGNIMEKQIPGKGVEYYVYNKQNQLVLYQDANMRSHQWWKYSVYDKFNRRINEKLVSSTYDVDQIRAKIDSVYTDIPANFKYGNLFVEKHFKLVQELSQTRYLRDKYNSDQVFSVPANLAFKEIDGVVNKEDTASQLQAKVYEKIYTLGIEDSDVYVERAFYYDSRGRLIQTVEKNITGNNSYYSYKYDFVGNLLIKQEIHYVNNMSPDILFTRYTYDDRGRVLNEDTRINDVSVANDHYQYTPLGKVSGIHGGRYNTGFKYNIQGWLQNKDMFYMATNVPPYKIDSVFSMKLSYYSGATPSFTGNISGAEFWYNGDSTIMNSYEYDYLNRLSACTSSAGDTSYEYTLNGVINSYTLNGVKTEFITDDIRPTKIIRSQPSVLDIFKFDDNGNMTFNASTMHTYTYNLYNLPKFVIFPNQMWYNFSYLADGSKYDDGRSQYYVGSLIYDRFNNQLISGALTHGRFIANHTDTGTTYSTHYHVTDHLANVHLVLDDDKKVLEKNIYYPFGLRKQDMSNPIAGYRFRFNSKEFYPVGYDGLYDYGARFYDPRAMIWLSPDAKAENHYSQSPYSFAGNNPVNNYDPDGNDYFRSASGAIIWQNEYGKSVTINNEQFTNVGSSFSQQMPDGNFVNYYQNAPISLTATPIDAERQVLNDRGTMGKLLGENSPLPIEAQHGLMTANLHEAQGNFIGSVADFSGTVLDVGGNGLAIAGYVVSATGVGAGIGTAMSGLGNGLSKIGTGIKMAVNIHDQKFAQAAVGFLGYGLSNGTGVISKVGAAGKETIEGGTNLFFAPMNGMINHIELKDPLYKK